MSPEQIKDYEKILQDMVKNRELNADWNQNINQKNKELKKKEKNTLAQDLGIDLTLESDRYSHFLDLAVNVVLPIGWRQETNPQGKIYYYNEFASTYSDSHPCVPFFKKLLNGKYKRFLKKYGKKVALGNTARYTNESKSFCYPSCEVLRG